MVREVQALKRDLDLAAKSALDDAQAAQRLRGLLKRIDRLSRNCQARSCTRSVREEQGKRGYSGSSL